MKRHSPSIPPTPTQNRSQQRPETDDWAQGDPVWDLLGEASTREPDAFFARNIVRSVRQTDSTPAPLTSRIAALFTSRKLALSAAACTAILVAVQMWPPSTPSAPVATSLPATTPATVVENEETNNHFSELIIEESLLAAAEDPTLFTRDEVVAMLNL